MSQFRLDPKNINQPIQLLGASLIGAVLLVGEFLYASARCNSQIMSWFFGITAILIFPIILYFIFIMQTKHRHLLQSDYYYFKTQRLWYEEQSNKLQPIKLEDMKWKK